ncbi:HAD hydrolase-like protein [Enterocloster lavalensis]|uniref:HAD hydrolase-like protein n=1 Tax=Enterocloster lavalensis TaxID=460384 RepID=UPI0023F3CC57|nr:HAD hydrolase-like protein [Enterocloster lavalensis]
MRKFLVCVDSDGTAMDTMNIKHFQCFGPILTEVFGLLAEREMALALWNRVNLYAATRGINRFSGLALVLGKIQEEVRPVEGLEGYLCWTKETGELSNRALREALEQSGNICMRRALDWSEKVNEAIGKLPASESGPFPGAADSLKLTKEYADIAVVSSANPEAVAHEWEYHGLSPYVDMVYAQDAGTKKECISKLCRMDYAPGGILMIGDAPGDLEAAVHNGVFFYPILVGKERESWQEYREEGLGRLLGGTFAGAYQSGLIERFWGNLEK